jgi:hypothetical protein
LFFIIKKGTNFEVICVAMAARRLSSLLSRSLGAYSSSGSASLLSSLGDDAFSVILLLSVLYLHDLCLLSNFASFFFH